MARTKAKPAFDTVVKKKPGRPPGGLPAGSNLAKKSFQSTVIPSGAALSSASPAGTGDSTSNVLNQLNLEKNSSGTTTVKKPKEKVIPLPVERPKREIRKRGGLAGGVQMDEEGYNFGGGAYVGEMRKGHGGVGAPSSTASNESMATTGEERETKRVKRDVSIGAQSDDRSLVGEEEMISKIKGKGRLHLPKSKISESIETNKEEEGDADVESLTNASSAVSGATGQEEDDIASAVSGSSRPVSGGGFP